MGNIETTQIVNTSDGFYSFLDITAEQIHSVLNSVYTIITSNASFEERKSSIQKLYRLYQPIFNRYMPHYYQFVRDVYGTEYFMFIATVGQYAIDLIMYYDLKDWVVLNSGMPIRYYSISGSSKLQNSVSKRSLPLNSEDRVYINSRKAKVDDIDKRGEYNYTNDTIVDYRCQPQINIVSPTKDSNFSDGNITLRVKLTNWTKPYRVLVNGEEYITTTNDNINLRLSPGNYRIRTELVDPYGRFNRISDEVDVRVKDINQKHFANIQDINYKINLPHSDNSLEPCSCGMCDMYFNPLDDLDTSCDCTECTECMSCTCERYYRKY